MFASWASEGAENCMKPCKQSIMKCLKCLLQQQQMRRCNSSFAGRTECPSRAAQLSRSHLSDTMINNYPCPPNGLRWPTKPMQCYCCMKRAVAYTGRRTNAHDMHEVKFNLFDLSTWTCAAAVQLQFWLSNTRKRARDVQNDHRSIHQWHLCCPRLRAIFVLRATWNDGNGGIFSQFPISHNAFFLSFFIRDTAVDAVAGMNANRRWLKNWKFYHRELNLFVPIQSDHFLPRPFFSLLSEEWSIYFIYFFSSILIWRAIKWWWFWCSGKAAAEADRFQHYILYIFQWPIRPDIMVIMMRLPGIPFSVPIVSILYILYLFYIYR